MKCLSDQLNPNMHNLELKIKIRPWKTAIRYRIMINWTRFILDILSGENHLPNSQMFGQTKKKENQNYPEDLRVAGSIFDWC